MFDIGFSELLLIGVVALIVIGPERLPKVARTAGHLFGRMQRYVSTVKADISREIELEELRKAGQSFKESVESMSASVQQEATRIDDYFRDETERIAKVTDAMTAIEGERPVTEAALKASSGDAVQRSLPLDEPDQLAPPPSAVIEVARPPADRHA
ncbi:MAG: Sec-independent protein translocase protein TatB [Thiobacillus sp.]